MKNLLIVLSIMLIHVSCTNEKNKSNEELKNNNISLIRENDSLKNLLAAKDSSVEIEKPTEDIKKPSPLKTGKGKHPITLQWISWDKPGYVDITPVEDNWYTILGNQTGDDGNNYLKIDGKIRRLSERELEFDGTIEILVEHNNNGEVCIKEGKQTFFAKGSRKYFRMQNMTNCEGGMLVDYVDIYPGNSSL